MTDVHQRTRRPCARRADSDLVVVGGGPAGIAAALAGARNGLGVTLLERYPYLGGLASGGMVLVLDDMCNGPEIAVRGICGELIDRMERLGLAVTPPEADRRSDPAMWRKWSRWGVFDFTSHLQPQPIVYAAAFDPDGFKRASNDMVAEAKIDLRLHSWFSRAIVEDGAIKGVVGREQGGPPGHPRQDRGRRHRRPRRRRLRRRAVHQRRLHRHHRVPPGRRRHRRGRALRVRGARSVQGDRPRGQAHHRRLVGQMVAEDAAARRRLVQLPAHGRTTTGSRSKT